MNHECLYSTAITKVVDGKISFEIPKDVLVFTSVQVIVKYGHGQNYIVTKGKHTVEWTSHRAQLPLEIHPRFQRGLPDLLIIS